MKNKGTLKIADSVTQDDHGEKINQDKKDAAMKKTDQKKDFKSVEEFGPHKPHELGELKHINVSQPDPNQLIVVASKSHRDEALEEYISKYNAYKIIHIF